MATTTLTPERAREQVDALNGAGIGNDPDAPPARQLSFDVGGKSPDRSSVKASIDLLIPRELRKGSEVRLQVIAADGEVLATTDAKVIAVTFEDDYKDGYIVGTERVHKVKAV